MVSQTEDKQTTTTQIVVPINKPTKDKTRALQEKEVALDHRQGAKQPKEITVVTTVNKNEENPTQICELI